jgi:hypothetical protein
VQAICHVPNSDPQINKTDNRILTLYSIIFFLCILIGKTPSYSCINMSVAAKSIPAGMEQIYIPQIKAAGNG